MEQINSLCALRKAIIANLEVLNNELAEVEKQIKELAPLGINTNKWNIELKSRTTTDYKKWASENISDESLLDNYKKIDYDLTKYVKDNKIKISDDYKETKVSGYVYNELN